MEKRNKVKNYRCCISCQKIAPKNEFLRIVRVHPNHEITLNQGMGRSAYLCPNIECITIAEKKKRLSKVLKTSVSPEIYLQLRYQTES